MKIRSAGFDARSLRQRFALAAWHIIKVLRQRLNPDRRRLTVLVAGMQRSGTNLVMEVLDASLSTDVFHETDPRAFDRYEMRPLAVIDALAESSPAPVFVIKALCELDRLPLLMARYAPAKTLWVVRDWRDSVHSAVRSFGNFVPQWARLARGDTSDWRGRGMSAETRDVLAGLWCDEATEAEGAALMWYYRNILFFEQGLERDERVSVVFYESLVSDPQAAVSRIYAFLGLPDAHARVARRIHARSVRHRSPEGIRPEIAQLCDALLARFHALEPAR